MRYNYRMTKWEEILDVDELNPYRPVYVPQSPDADPDDDQVEWWEETTRSKQPNPEELCMAKSEILILEKILFDVLQYHHKNYDASEIIKMRADGYTLKQIASAFGIHSEYIRQCFSTVKAVRKRNYQNS